MKPIKSNIQYPISNIQYPALGSTTLANKIYQLLNQHGIDAKLDDERGFDHGVYSGPHCPDKK